ncbi:MAG: TetR/AcrR family transcriptional regulator [Clostridiales bacterium]|nr:TetR/AcrR family transcriptional regulator [Clostridiales bacterium]
MPPKQRITREMILERSFEMFCREGMEVVNARSVAKALNCSTQPIFSYFSGMEDLKNALEEKAKELFAQALQVDDQPGDPVINIGCAYTRFAAEQPCLFMHLFMINKDDPLYPFISEENRSLLVQREAEHTGLTLKAAWHLYVHMSVYIHGLAATRAAHKCDFTPEQMSEMIQVSHGLYKRTLEYLIAHPEEQCGHTPEV